MTASKPTTTPAPSAAPTGTCAAPSWGRRWLSGWQQWRQDDLDVATAARAINLGRMRLGALLMAAVSMGHGLVFSLSMDSLPPEQRNWAQHIWLIHTAMVLPMLTVAGLAWRGLRQPDHRWAQPLAVVTASCVLVFAIALTLADQAVTPAISAYLNACTGVALVFLLRPRHAVLLFVVAGGVMLAGLSHLGLSPAAHISNQANVVSSSLMALMVSVLLWRTFTRAELLQRQLTHTNATLRQQQAQLEQLATRDPLTGLLNRRAFEERAQHELRRAQREGTPLALVMLDLDHFKAINDHWGHPAGDAVLAQAAQLLAQGVRATDVAARWGGEEFIALLPNTSAASARQLADKLRLAQEHARTSWQGKALQVTASWGVAALVPGGTDTLDHLVSRADQALYEAKHLGRNQVVLGPAPSAGGGTHTA